MKPFYLAFSLAPLTFARIQIISGRKNCCDKLCRCYPRQNDAFFAQKKMWNDKKLVEKCSHNLKKKRFFSWKQRKIFWLCVCYSFLFCFPFCGKVFVVPLLCELEQSALTNAKCSCVNIHQTRKMFWSSKEKSWVKNVFQHMINSSRKLGGSSQWKIGFVSILGWRN